MTASYQLLVPLPNGVTRTTPLARFGRLSVFIIPRLQADGELNDWIRDWSIWPRVINGTAPGPPPGVPLTPPMTFSVGIDAAPVPANSGIGVGDANWLTPAPSEAAWSALFGTNGPAGSKSIRVDRFRVDLKVGDDLLAPMYDAPGLTTGVEQLLRDIAESFSSTIPTVSELNGIGSYGSIIGSGVLSDRNDHLAPLGDGNVDNEPTPADSDFHEIVAYAQAHPELLRALGLLIDLEVRLPNSPPPYVVTVTSNLENLFPAAKAVPMRVRATTDFWPVEGSVSGPGPGDWSPIGDGSHTVGSVDLGSASTAVANVDSGLEPDDETQFGGFNSGGIYLTRKPVDLITEVEGRWDAQEELEEDIEEHLDGTNTGPVDVDTDALIGGRRYDVWDETTQRWYSLWDRIVPAGYAFPRNPGLDITPDGDEGWMTYTAFTEMARKTRDPNGVNINPDPNPNPDIGGYKITPAPARFDDTRQRLSPLVFGWNGWSEAADPPQKSAFSGATGPEVREPNLPPTDMGGKVGVTYEVPDGVLPRLRYTRQYKFRARVVDLGGHSLSIEDNHGGGTNETALYRYGRMNPMGRPVPIRREPTPIPGWGDTVTTLVIKSDFDIDDATVAPTTRLLFPPSTTQYQCELHGFPTPDDALFRDQANFDMFVNRTAASIEAHTAIDPDTSELFSQPLGEWRPEVGYLVEPAMAGISLIDIPGATGSVVMPIQVGWPLSHAVSFEMRAGDGAPVVPPPTDSGPTAIIQVPKGITRTVYAATAADAGLATHWKTLQDWSQPTSDRLLDDAVAGDMWGLSERQPLTLVHAVQRPLTLPIATVDDV
ncbi:MAG: hypothetical protein AAFY28_19955, partial [Actinomycetota bacterium]